MIFYDSYGNPETEINKEDSASSHTKYLLSITKEDPKICTNQNTKPRLLSLKDLDKQYFLS